MMSRRHRSPLAAVAAGVAAGLIGTAAMTAYQTAVAIRRGSTIEQQVTPPPPTSWEQAPAPGRVGYRLLQGLFDREPPLERATALTNAVHWSYGGLWGAAYGIVRESERLPVVADGAALGSTVFAAGYAVLPAMGVYRVPWEYSGRTLAVDWSYHLVDGLATAIAYRLLP